MKKTFLLAALTMLLGLLVMPSVVSAEATDWVNFTHPTPANNFSA